jgi:hypothetical protein
MSDGPSAAYWRDKAADSRSLASAMAHIPSRDVLLQIAAEYDKLAAYVEHIEAGTARLKESG